MTTTTDSSFTLHELLSHRDWAQRLARQLVGTADADDLVQDGWMAGLVARPPDRDGLRPWLATVLSRAAGRRRRGDQRRGARELASGVLQQTTVPGPEALVAQVEVQRLLAELVLALEPAVRDVILLRFYQGLTSPEIARELAIPEGTVRWRVKTGLAELRARLDQRHGGGRDEWLGLLAPMRGTRPGNGRAASATLAGGACLLGGVLVAMVWLWPPARSRPTIDVATANAGKRSVAAAPATLQRDQSSLSSSGRPPQLAALTADDCQARLTEVRRDLSATEVEFVETARANFPSALFDHGAPNPAAEATLAPLLASFLATTGAARPAGHTLACRTLICRLDVLLPANAPGFDWVTLLRQNPELSDRARPTSPRERGPALQDAVTGGSYHQERLYLALWTPAAEAFSRARLIEARGTPPLPPPVFGPLPTDPGACRGELAAAQQRLATMNDVIQRHMLPNRRWERSSPNPELTREMDALARRILALPPDSTAVMIACRSDVCRVDFDRQRFPDPNDWKQLFTPEWRRRARGPSSVGAWQSFFSILPPKPAPP